MANTASSAKKSSSKAAASLLANGTNSASTDYYLQEKWSQFKKELKQEYDMIA